jgi:AcrR family transcriptional regulator
MPVFTRNKPEQDTRSKILSTARHLFARRGYDGTTTRELAENAGIAEGTLFRHFSNKKAILVEVATQGWVELLTDLLMELSEMANYEAIAQVIYKRMLHLGKNYEVMRICFMEVQFHSDLQEKIQKEVVAKMTDVAEAFFQTAIDRGVYRPLNAKVVAQVFLGMFVIAGFSHDTLLQPEANHQDMRDMAEGLADIFLNGVLARRA